MNCKSLFAVAGIAAIAGSIALAQPAKESKPAPAKLAAEGQPQQGMPSMTEQQKKDMAACEAAAKTGAQHAHLTSIAGTWSGKSKMWMSADDKNPMVSECKEVIAPIMDGKFVKCEVTGDMPGIGPFSGFGINGFDNVSQKYVGTWVDNCGTGIWNGTGELSADKKVLTWKYNYNCPVTKKLATAREVETRTGPDSMTFEMFMNDPHTGKEYKVTEIAFTRTSASTAKAAE